MAKGPDAFRTISEVAEWLDVPTHVLRFWESRFTQVKPVKRAGGRRYYRPADMQLLGGIKRLLHDEGLTIRGVQKLLREEGVRHVAALSPPIDGDTPDQPSAKVITLNTARSAMDEAPHHWPDPDEPEDAVETLAAYLDDADADARDTLDDERPHADEAPAPVDASQAGWVPEPVSAGSAPDAPAQARPEPSATEPFLDVDALELPPLVIAPLAAMGRTARARQARALSSALIEAEILAHAWDARM